MALLALSPYLRLALSPEVMRGHWATRVLDPAKLAAELAANKDAEVLVVESGYLQSADARELVSRYLPTGAASSCWSTGVTPAVERDAARAGFRRAGPSRLGPSRPRSGSNSIFSNHPVFHPFLSPDYGNLLEVTVRRHAHD